MSAIEPIAPCALDVSNSTTTLTALAIVWTPAQIAASAALFFAAGLCEIAGSWLVWNTVREQKPWWFAALGAAVLVLYGFVPTFQSPAANFSRILAVYGGVFICMSYLWGWLVDSVRPDVGDLVGGGVALTGVALAWFWPR